MRIITPHPRNLFGLLYYFLGKVLILALTNFKVNTSVIKHWWFIHSLSIIIRSRWWTVILCMLSFLDLLFFFWLISDFPLNGPVLYLVQSDWVVVEHFLLLYENYLVSVWIFWSVLLVANFWGFNVFFIEVRFIVCAWTWDSFTVLLNFRYRPLSITSVKR